MEKREYIVTKLEIMTLSPENLLSGEFDNEIKKRMEEVIETEAPLRESILLKRVLNSFFLYKLGSRLNKHFIALENELDAIKTTDCCGEIVFHNGKNEDFFRPTPIAEVRYSYQIPTAEASNALIYIIENSTKNSFTKNELLRLFINEMGWEKNGDKIEALFSDALKDERIKRSRNGRIIK